MHLQSVPCALLVRKAGLPWRFEQGPVMAPRGASASENPGEGLGELREEGVIPGAIISCVELVQACTFVPLSQLLHHGHKLVPIVGTEDMPTPIFLLKVLLLRERPDRIDVQKAACPKFAVRVACVPVVS